MDGIPFFRQHATPFHRLLTAVVLSVCLLILLHTYFVEPFQVPTGSMAPTLLGHHRSGVCPRCAFVVDVGRTQWDRDGTGGERYYTRAFCPNCGCADLALGKAPEARGNHVLVNKSLYRLRPPRRWEVVVFRLFGKVFIKRLIGLGGEDIELADGDVYIDGKLARKTFDEFLAMRVLVFDNDFAPEPAGWRKRWEYQPETTVPPAPKQPLTLDGRRTPQLLTYQNYSLDERKCLPILDEYAYNAGVQSAAQAVHDFMAEAEVEVVAGQGTLGFALSDGDAEVEIVIGVAAARDAVTRVRGPLAPFSPVLGREGLGVRAGAFAQAGPLTPNPSPPPTGAKGANGEAGIQLDVGKRYHIEMALVDRRLTLRVDGRDVVAPLDLPEAKERAPVIRPLRFTANGVLARLHHVRLYRDLHYTQAGTNGVRGRSARLGINQTFVLGDNSPNSEDSRFWPNQGAVPLHNLVGRAFLVHLPSRAAAWEGWGRQWQYQLPDWERIGGFGDLIYPFALAGACERATTNQRIGNLTWPTTKPSYLRMGFSPAARRRRRRILSRTRSS